MPSFLPGQNGLSRTLSTVKQGRQPDVPCRVPKRKLDVVEGFLGCGDRRRIVEGEARFGVAQSPFHLPRGG